MRVTKAARDLLLTRVRNKGSKRELLRLRKLLVQVVDRFTVALERLSCLLKFLCQNLNFFGQILHLTL